MCDCYIPFQVFSDSFSMSQWRNQFSDKNLRILHQYLSDMGIISLDPGAISMTYEQVEIKDIHTDVNYCDYVDMDMDYEDHLEWVYGNISDIGFWTDFANWKLTNKSAIKKALKAYNVDRYDSKEYYDTEDDFSDNELAKLVKYRTDNPKDLYKFIDISCFISEDYLNTEDYINAILNEIDLVGPRPEYLDLETSVLIVVR